MFKLDENFLKELGLDSLPQEQKLPFLQHIYDELELQVGMKLSEGVSDEALSSFESIIDKKHDEILNWLNSNAPAYFSDKKFIELKSKSGFSDDNLDLLSEFAANKWLEINRPDYKEVVAGVMASLKNEIISKREAILSSE